MPEEFDPAWEYFTADAEVYAAVYGNGRRARSILDYLPGAEFNQPLNQLGYRFGRGNPDYFSGKLARPKPERYREPPKPKPPKKPRGYLNPRCCEFCKVAFKPANHLIRFCSRDCFHDHRGLPVLEVECLTCSAVFKTRKPDRVFCSKACWKQKVKAPTHKTCSACGTRFKKTNSRKAFCSAKCRTPRGRKRTLPNATCPGCGTEFRPGRKAQKYCSLGCRPAAGVGAKWKARTLMRTLRAGDRVILKTPGNLIFDRKEAVVKTVESWGCHVTTGAGSGKFRAAWDEMEYVAPSLSREEAVGMGYTGNPCPSCQLLTLRPNGTCFVCDTCKETTGCS